MITEMTTSSVLPSGGGKIKRPSFKSRGGAGPHINRTGSFKSYQTIRVSVPSTMVAELASKFNAVVVDANQGDSMQAIMKKVNKTLAKGSTARTKVTTVREKGVVVRATVEKFESTSQKKRCINQMVVVRTNSNQRMAAERPTAIKQATAVEYPTAIQQPTTVERRKMADHLTSMDYLTTVKQPPAVEQRKVTDHLTTMEHHIDIQQQTVVEERNIVDHLTGVEQRITMLNPTAIKNPAAEQRKTMNQQTSSSVVKKLLVQFENGKKPSKPSVLGPKPIVTTRSIRRNERRPPLQKDTTVTVDRHLLNKDKRLSIARDPDAQLESVLNVMPPPKNLQHPMRREQSPPRDDLNRQRPTERERSPPREDLNQQQPIERERSPSRKDLKQQQQPTEVTAPAKSPPPLPLKPNCSFLHGWKRPTTLTTTAAASITPTTNTPATTTPTEFTPATTTSTTSTSTTTTHNTTIPATTTSTITTLTTTTPAYNKGERHSVGEVQSSQLLSSLVVASPTHSVIASLAEATLTSTGFTADTTALAADTTTEIGSHNYNYIVGEESIYEELRYIRLTSTDSGTHTTEAPNVVLENPYDHYSTIDGGEQNIYDVVTTATTAYEDTSYETVQPPLPPLPTLPVISVTVVDASPQQLPVDSDSDENGHQEKKEMFDNSVEIDNSIYGINPPSESTSSGNKKKKLLYFITSYLWRKNIP